MPLTIMSVWEKLEPIIMEYRRKTGVQDMPIKGFNTFTMQLKKPTNDT